ncbi:DUF58 domain-containing protein [Paenalcaligenes niemegkensis]|uniref:DUF58 domain-containing protein n=1 Tax=Paenalcaligenes niemegkensis TaxID=2895469 RepID=UPI001EE9926E
MDLRRSLRDPFGQWYVKDYEPRAPVQIHLLVDVSASMQTGSHQRQIDQVADICALVAQAAYRNGDALSFFACGSTIEYQYAPPTSAREPIVPGPSAPGYSRHRLRRTAHKLWSQQHSASDAVAAWYS